MLWIWIFLSGQFHTLTFIIQCDQTSVCTVLGLNTLYEVPLSFGASAQCYRPSLVVSSLSSCTYLVDVYTLDESQYHNTGLFIQKKNSSLV